MNANSSIHNTSAPATPPSAAVLSGSWLTPDEAANHIGVYVETIYDACKTQGLKHVRLGGRRSIRIHESWLEGWMTEFTREYR
jgi:excisionase family DNA binding protein